MAEFFRRYEPDPQLFRGYRHILDAIDVYRAARHPEIAARLDAAFQAMLANVERQTVRSAARTDQRIRATLRERLVRSPTAGPHLADRVHSLPVPTRLPAGALGVADIEQLDQAVDPDYPRSPYWRAIEYGSDAAVGRIVVGYFQPGGGRGGATAPAADEFRHHPYFLSNRAAPAGPSPPAMKVQRPIEPKHFLRDGSREALAEHEAAMTMTQAEGLAAMSAVTMLPLTGRPGPRS